MSSGGEGLSPEKPKSKPKPSLALVVKIRQELMPSKKDSNCPLLPQYRDKVYNLCLSQAPQLTSTKFLGKMAPKQRRFE